MNNVDLKNSWGALKEGDSYTAGQVVAQKDTATHYGSGTVDVFATPAMIALMENAAMHTALRGLPEGFGTVGTAVNVQHIRATPIGMKVTATAVLEKIDGKQLVFKVTAHDEKGEIGHGAHTRYIIETAKFMNKLNA